MRTARSHVKLKKWQQWVGERGLRAQAQVGHYHLMRGVEGGHVGAAQGSRLGIRGESKEEGQCGRFTRACSVHGERTLGQWAYTWGWRKSK